MMYGHALDQNSEKARRKHPGVYNSSSDAIHRRTGERLI